MRKINLSFSNLKNIILKMLKKLQFLSSKLFKISPFLWMSFSLVKKQSEKIFLEAIKTNSHYAIFKYCHIKIN